MLRTKTILKNVPQDIGYIIVKYDYIFEGKLDYIIGNKIYIQIIQKLPDGRIFVVEGVDNYNIRIYNPDMKEILLNIPLNTKNIKSWLVLKDGRIVIGGSRSIRIFSATGTHDQELKTEHSVIMLKELTENCIMYTEMIIDVFITYGICTIWNITNNSKKYC